MRNIILLIKQLSSFFIFLVLELVCLIIVFRNNSYQQTSYINSSRNITGKFYNQKNKIMGFMNLRKINDSLMKENAYLRNQVGITVPGNPLKDTSYTKNIQSDTVNQTVHYTYIPAKVINNTIDQKVNYITLDVGSKDGVQEKMTVITPEGIVGKISHVSKNYSVALSLLSDRFNVSCVVADGTYGSLSWDGKDPDYAILSGIPQSVKLKPRDSVFTSGFGNFPEKILVGRAAQVLNGTSYKIYLSTHFRKLHFVYIVAEKVDIERKVLEDSTQVKP